MHCVALQHLDHDPPGLLELPLRERGWSLEIRRPENGASALAGLTDPSVDLLLVLGGTMGAYETARVPYLGPETERIGARLRAGLPVLGICLGAQLMAAALGGRVYNGPRPEIGWLPVNLTAEGAADPVAALLLEPSPVTLQWHEDTFDTPAGGVNLALSASYPAQGFRHGRWSYALQFHPEVPLADLPVWIERSQPPLTGPPRTPWPQEILQGARLHHAAYERRTAAFMHRYLERLEERPAGRGGSERDGNATA